MLFSLFSCGSDKEKVTELNAEIEELGDQVSLLTAQVNELTAEKNQLTQQLAEKASAVEDLNRKLQILREESDALATEVAAKRTEVEKLKSALEGKTDEVTQLRADLDAKNAKLSELTKQLAEKGSLISSLETDLAAKNAEIEELKATVDTKDAEINELKEELNKANEEIVQLRAQIAELTAIPEYTVSFNLAGGVGNCPDQKVKQGEKLTAPEEPTKDGYVFLGWFCEGEKWVFSGYTVTESITLTAKWSSNCVLSVTEPLSLEGNKITAFLKYPLDFIDLKELIKVDSEAALKLFSDNALTNECPLLRFSGLTEGENRAWLTVECEGAETNIYEVSVRILRVAEFFSEEKLFTYVIAQNGLINEPAEQPEASIPGYCFSHWELNGEKAEFPLEYAIGLELSAAYTAVDYSVEYALNGGEMTDTEYVTSYNTEGSYMLPEPKRELYLFDGWYESADFTTECLTELKKGSLGNKTLYAKWLSATDGVTYELSEDGEFYTVTGYDESGTEVVIAESINNIPVTKIADNAFSGMQRIVSITIANSVTEIGSGAFENCLSLATLKLGSGLTKIPNNMLKGRCALTSLFIPKTVTEIGSSAFEGCEDLKTVTLEEGSELEAIDYYAFSGCSSLEAFHMPSTVTELNLSAFSGCTSLKDVTISEGVTEIGIGCFSGCTSLKGVTIPAGVVALGNSCFEGCTSLTGVSFAEDSRLLTFGASCFEGCSSLIGVIIPSGVQEIGYSAFYECKALRYVIIPQSVITIKYYVFDYTQAVTVYTEWISKPDGWDDSWQSAYSGGKTVFGILSYGITEEGLVYVETANEGMSILRYVGNGESLVIPETINGRSVVQINSYALSSSTLTDVTVAASVTALQDYSLSSSSLKIISFAEGSRLSFVGSCALANTAITEITIPGNNTVIGNEAFYSCRSLTDVTLCEGVVTIGTEAFMSCSKLRKIIIPASVTKMGSYVFEFCDLLTIYCRAAEKPSGWTSSWSKYTDLYDENHHSVIFGYTDE